MGKVNNEKITSYFIKLSSKTKYLFCGILTYYLILILYDVIVRRTSINEFLVTGLICLITWFGVKLLFWIQIKNALCNDFIFNLFSLFAIFAFGITIVTSTINYFFQEFDSLAFVAPITVLSVISIQSFRKKDKK